MLFPKLLAALIALTIIVVAALIVGGHNPTPILDLWRIWRGA